MNFREDMIALPGFSSHSGDNWGLMTMERSLMLYFYRSSSVNELKLSTDAIARDFSHMWFNSFATINWWSDIWLCESFAIYMQYYTTDFIFPEWNEVFMIFLNPYFSSLKVNVEFFFHVIIRSVAFC